MGIKGVRSRTVGGKGGVEEGRIILWSVDNRGVGAPPGEVFEVVSKL